jgi:hypothetical protein
MSFASAAARLDRRSQPSVARAFVVLSQILLEATQSCLIQEPRATLLGTQSSGLDFEPARVNVGRSGDGCWLLGASVKRPLIEDVTLSLSRLWSQELM